MVNSEWRQGRRSYHHSPFTIHLIELRPPARPFQAVDGNKTDINPTPRFHAAALAKVNRPSTATGLELAYVSNLSHARNPRRHPSVWQEHRRQQCRHLDPSRPDGRHHRPLGRRQVDAFAHDQPPHRSEPRVDFL
ncbi:hypothetical protein BQ8794_330050 [Mesorhizobium prunaredense]|uniref:Uncharacterized protein n=1 Tax=Mesorhizobium prunaredense TaxID=1631249 RepID=A0A1R3VBT1_9HYPH|nr:hypothetical protein BQ8794_330050 [Mesorhizobium prunaredense]